MPYSIGQVLGGQAMRELNKKQISFLKENKLDPKDFLLERTTMDDYIFFNIKSKTLWPIRR